MLSGQQSFLLLFMVAKKNLTCIMDTSFKTVATLTRLKVQIEFICYGLLSQFNKMTIDLVVDYIESGILDKKPV